MDSQWYELFTPGITLERFGSPDSFGNPGYSAAESFSGRIESIDSSQGGGRQRDNREPNDPTINVRIITDYLGSPISIRDKVTLPAGETMYVRSVTTHYDEIGPHHIVMSLSTEDEQ